MGAHGGEIQTLQVVHGGGQADGAGDVRGAGLELERQLGVGGRLKAHMLDHLAAGLPRRHRLQQLLAADERADARGAVHLVAGEGVEVAAERLHVHRQVRRGLGAVHHRHRARRPASRRDLGHVVDGAQGVGDVGHGDDLGARAQLGVEVVHVQFAVGEHRHGAQLGAETRTRQLPRHDVGVVLHVRDEHFVAFAKHQRRVARGHQIDGLGGAPRPDHLARGAGVDALGDGFPRRFKGAGGFVRKPVRAAMHIGVAAAVVVLQRLQHLPRLLRGGGVVEIDHVRDIAQQRKVGPPRRRAHGSRPKRLAPSGSWTASARKARVSSARAVSSPTPRVRR